MADVVAITETWLKPGDSYDRPIFRGFSYFRGDRKGRRIDWRVLVLIAKLYGGEEGERLNTSNKKATEITVTVEGLKATVARVYRSPAAEVTKDIDLPDAILY